MKIILSIFIVCFMVIGCASQCDRQINVIGFGAYPDSTHPEETANAITLACRYAYLNQINNVYIPEGVYYIGSNWISVYPNQHLRGSGQITTKITKGMDGIENAMIYASHPADTVYYMFGEQHSRSAKLHISDMTLEGARGFNANKVSSGDSDGGIVAKAFPSPGREYGRYRELLFERLTLKRMNVAGIYFIADRVKIKDIIAQSGNFTMLSGGGRRVEITNVMADSCRLLLETSSFENWASTGDSSTSLIMRNITSENGWGYGIAPGSFDYISISGFDFSNQLTAPTYGTDGYAIKIQPLVVEATNQYQPLGTVQISDGHVKHMIGAVVVRETPDGGVSIDTTFKDILISNITTEDIYENAIKIIGEKDGEHRSIGSTIIQNCNLTGWNVRNKNTIAGILIQDIDTVSIRNNTIYTLEPTPTSILKYVPVKVKGSIGVTIHNNDFRAKGASSAQSALQSAIATDLISTGLVVYNNQGLDRHKAIWYVPEGGGSAFRRQSMEVTEDGVIVNNLIIPED